MPARLVDKRAGELEDRKALLDWLYLGESNYSRIAGAACMGFSLDWIDIIEFAEDVPMSP